MLHHLLKLENLVFHLLQPIFGAPSLDWSLQIFLAEDTVLHMKDLGVLLQLCEGRVDDVDDELVLGGTWRSHGPQNPLKVFQAETNRERKHTRLRDTVPGRSGQIYSKNFCNRRKVLSLGGVRGGVRGSQEGARRGQEVGPRQGASWPPWSSSPAPIGLGIFLILQKL